MALEYVVESLDGLDEAVKGAYVEKEGKFNLDPDKYSEIKAQGLKNKNRELLQKLTDAKNGTKRFDIFADVEDDDLSEFSEWLKTKGQPNGNGNGKPDADTEAKIAAIQKQLDKASAKHGTEKAELEKKLADLAAENRHYKLTVPLRDVAVKAGVIPADLDLVMLDTQKRFTLSDDGKDKIVLLDEDGDPTDITPQKFFESLYKEQRPKFYQATGAGGSGATPNNGGGGTGLKKLTMEQFNALMPQAKMDFMKEVREGKAERIQPQA